jgi:hypothetical protein
VQTRCEECSHLREMIIPHCHCASRIFSVQSMSVSDGDVKVAGRLIASTQVRTGSGIPGRLQLRADAVRSSFSANMNIFRTVPSQWCTELPLRCINSPASL